MVGGSTGLRVASPVLAILSAASPIMPLLFASITSLVVPHVEAGNAQTKLVFLASLKGDVCPQSETFGKNAVG